MASLLASGSGADALPVGAATLFNSIRPALVRNLVQPGAAAARNPSGSSATRFQPVSGPLIVDTMLPALCDSPELARAIRPTLDQAVAAYEEQAKASGLDHDIAAALSLLTAAADMGYRNREISDAESVIVAHQLQRAFDTPELRAATDRQKQELYEFFTTFGVYLLLTRQAAVQSGGDAPARLKAAAASALNWTYGVAADAVTIDQGGLHVKLPVVADNPPPPPPTPSRSNQGAIVGTWRSIGIESTFHSDSASYGISDELRVRVVAFLPNGWFTSATALPDYPRRDPVASSKTDPYYWGRYTFDGQKGVIQFAAGSPSPFEIVDGKLHYERHVYTGPHALP